MSQKRKMNLIFTLGTIISVLFFISCNSEPTTKEVSNNFTKAEIKDLNKIIAFYKTEISDNPSSDFEASFKFQLKEFTEKGENSKIYDLDYSKQEALYNSISKETFNAIWSFCELYIFKTDTTKRILCFESKTKYKSFLTDVAKYNKHIAEYEETLNNSASISTTWLEQTIIMYPGEFDLADPNIQLIIAIHYLFQNDINKRNEIMK